jgi:flagellar protein FliS
MKAPSPNAYLQTKVLTSNPAELRLMLFDGAIRFAAMAHDGLNRKDFDAAFTGITRCQDILLELINGLRPDQDPQLCQKLSALYTFMYTRLMLASSERDPAIVAEVLKLLQYERETWAMLLEQLAAENKSAATARDVPHDVAPTIPPPPGSLSAIVGGTVSLRA